MWFVSKLNDHKCQYLIAEYYNQPIGSFRLDIDDSGCGYISYLVDPNYHGKGYGSQLMNLGILHAKESSKINCLVGEVMSKNYASIKLFDKLGFTIISRKENLLKYNLMIE
jgi:RimJ/RimL family protein N-acetyltransferase